MTVKFVLNTTYCIVFVDASNLICIVQAYFIIQSSFKTWERKFDGFQRDTNIPYCCKDRAMWGAAGGLGLTQVFLYRRFFPGLPDYPAVA